MVFERVREIVDDNGGRLRVTVAADQRGALVTLELPDGPGKPRLLLGPSDAELLSGYLMSARLALPYGLPDEPVARGLAQRLRLVLSPSPLVEVTQNAHGSAFPIPASYWDKLYAELCMVVAHTRDLPRLGPISIH